MHTYTHNDCKALIAAKKLPYQIVKIGGMFGLRVNFSEQIIPIKSWEELYEDISAIPTEPETLAPADAEVIDPKTMTDADFAVK